MLLSQQSNIQMTNAEDNYLRQKSCRFGKIEEIDEVVKSFEKLGYTKKDAISLTSIYFISRG